MFARLSRGLATNVSFADACRLLEQLGFVELRSTGSHHIYAHPRVPEQLNLQSHRGEAKPYQLRQLMALVRRYDLSIKERP